MFVRVFSLFTPLPSAVEVITLVGLSPASFRKEKKEEKKLLFTWYNLVQETWGLLTCCCFLGLPEELACRGFFPLPAMWRTETGQNTRTKRASMLSL